MRQHPVAILQVRRLRDRLIPDAAGTHAFHAVTRPSWTTAARIGAVAGLRSMLAPFDGVDGSASAALGEHQRPEWAVPVIAIAMLTVGTSLIGDGLARASIGIDRERGV